MKYIFEQYAAERISQLFLRKSHYWTAALGLQYWQRVNWERVIRQRLNGSEPLGGEPKQQYAVFSLTFFIMKRLQAKRVLL